MLKKSIIGLILLALAMPAFAGDTLDYKWEKGTWPVVFKFMPACDKIKVVMNVGYYVSILDCKKLKITLGQEGIHQYKGCTDFKVKCNFDLELGAQVYPTAAGLEIQSNLGKWSAWIDGDQFVEATTSWEKRKVCVRVKDAGIGNADPNKDLTVAYVTIYVRPTAQPSPQ